MSHSKLNINQEEKDLKKIVELVTRNFKLFGICILATIILAFFINRFSTPVYRISSSILIKEETASRTNSNMNEFLHSSLFGVNQNFQNELFVLKSSPVIEQTIKNLDLSVCYLQKNGFHYREAYESVPFKILYSKDHIQPINVRFHITKLDGERFQINAKSKEAAFYIYNSNEIIYKKKKWLFQQIVKEGELVQTPDLSFIIQKHDTRQFNPGESASFYFEFKDIPSQIANFKNNFQIATIDRLATVIEISLTSKSYIKGKDIVNELMDVYSRQNLDRKNHTALITIDYIEKQLNEISESLNETEDNLQSFRSSKQLLNISEQATGISAQYLDLQNQQAELVTRKRYYDYVSDYLSKNDDFSNMIVPASMGIPDQLLNNLMSELITAQAQRSNLITNKQEKNPLVQKLSIQIENTKKTISDNIAAIQKTTDISIDEMNKRIQKVEAEISQLPKTQRQLGGIERKYRLNDAIYNYLLEKRAEAKITQASNLPDNIIIEPAKMDGFKPISPKKSLNYLIALLSGFLLPFIYLLIRSELINKIEAQDNIERLTHFPVLGKILHNTKKTNNVMFEFPKSNIAESYRALRTNLDYQFKGLPKKVIMVTSCIEGEGKSFNALNIAMSYAQLDREVIVADFDLRKNSKYFGEPGESLTGLSSYLTDNIGLNEVIINSPHSKLDYIPSGPIPPDPVELLANDKTGELINEIKSNYDVVVLDTPPLAQVTDAFLLVDYADIIIIVARYNYSNKKVFSLIMKDIEQKGIKNVCIVLNDNRIYRDQYGYGYGYYKKGN
jgi:tyrosine-protein kinase Etk/Wzc